MVGFQPAWNVETGDPGTVVAVMDTGADLTHPDLVNQLWTNISDGSHGYDFVDSDSDPTDLSGHGTHVSGIIAAEGDNGIDTTGVARPHHGDQAVLPKLDRERPLWPDRARGLRS